MRCVNCFQRCNGSSWLIHSHTHTHTRCITPISVVSTCLPEHLLRLNLNDGGYLFLAVFRSIVVCRCGRTLQSIVYTRLSLHCPPSTKLVCDIVCQLPPPSRLAQTTVLGVLCIHVPTISSPQLAHCLLLASYSN